MRPVHCSEFKGRKAAAVDVASPQGTSIIGGPETARPRACQVLRDDLRGNHPHGNRFVAAVELPLLDTPKEEHLLVAARISEGAETPLVVHPPLVLLLLASEDDVTNEARNAVDLESEHQVLETGSELQLPTWSRLDHHAGQVLPPNLGEHVIQP